MLLLLVLEVGMRLWNMMNSSRDLMLRVDNSALILVVNLLNMSLWVSNVL